MNEDERDNIKAKLILMRRFAIQHDLQIGECIAWRDLKNQFGVGQNDEEDEAWMRQYTGKWFSYGR